MCCSVCKFFGSCLIRFEHMENAPGGVRAFDVPPLDRSNGGPLRFDVWVAFLVYSVTASFCHLCLPGCAFAVAVVAKRTAGPSPSISLSLSLSLTAGSDLSILFRGKNSWVVEIISGGKVVVLVSCVAPPSSVVHVPPGAPQHGLPQYCGVWC